MPIITHGTDRISQGRQLHAYTRQGATARYAAVCYEVLHDGRVIQLIGSELPVRLADHQQIQVRPKAENTPREHAIACGRG
jgi:hypothetical protein